MDVDALVKAKQIIPVGYLSKVYDSVFVDANFMQPDEDHIVLFFFDERHSIVSEAREAEDPVAQVEDKTEYVEFVPSKGVITIRLSQDFRTSSTSTGMRQMQSQLGSVSGQMLGSKERPWKTVFGDRYKAVIKTLNKYIPFEAISTIQYSNGTQIPYVTGFYVYSAMNAIFGPDAWSYTVSTIRSGQGLYSATVTISIAGVIRSNGSASKQTKGVAPEQLAIKSAITNAFKRAAANFGNVLGLCLYDKAYINEFIKEKKNKRIPLNEKKVIEELYELSHPDGEIDTKPIMREEVMKMHTEGLEEGSITSVREEVHSNHGAIIPTDCFTSFYLHWHTIRVCLRPH